MTALEKWLGKWRGHNQLWLRPGEDSHDSATTAVIATVAQGQFTTFSYSWAYDGDPQDGLIIFGSKEGALIPTAVWFDSWHMRHDVMLLRASGDDQSVRLEGSYAAPPGPDWGWRIELGGESADRFVLRMFNITPDGLEAPAVLAEYRRV